MATSIWSIEDFAKLRRINHKLVHTEFIPEWNFRLDIPGAPKNFDFYVKDITYGLIDIATDEQKIGAGIYVWPTGSNPHRCSFTVRDNKNGGIQAFFQKWKKYVFPGDGTVNVPFGTKKSNPKGVGYLKEVTLYEVQIDGEEVAHWTHLMYPTNMGEVSRSRENPNFLEIPVTLAEFSSFTKSS